MKSDKSLSRKINKIVSKKQDEMERQPAVFATTVAVPNQINYNYVVIGDKTVPVYNERVPAKAGVKIWVGYDAMDQSARGKKRYQVLGTRSEDPTRGVASSFGYAPSSRYEWNAPGGGQDMLQVHLRAISFLRIGASKLDGHIYLYSGRIWSGTEFISVPRQDINITAHIPSTEGKAALVMISIDTSGAVVQTKGSEVDITSLAETDRPSVPADTAFVSGCVRVYYGQVIPQEGRVNTDFDDLRLSGYGSSGGGGGGGTVESVSGDGVDNTDPTNPVISYPTPADIGAELAGAAASAQAAAESYADALVVGLWDDRGAFDASGGAYPSTGGSGTAGAIKKGDVWTISVTGTLPTSQVVEVGDVVRALIDSPGNTQANWAIIQNNIGYVAENSANKSTTMTGHETSNILYLTAKAIYDWAIVTFPQHSASAAANDFLVGSGTGAWIKKTLAQTITILRSSLDSVYAALSHTHAAGDVTSGTFDAARLPAPTTTALGGVKRNTGSAGQYITGIDSGGALTYDTPAGGGGANGWTAVTDSWSYASTSTITVPSGAASIYSIGDKIKFTQSGTVKYAYVVTVADTLLTLLGDTVANSAISSIYYSHQLSPVGFPHEFSYTPSSTYGITVGNGTLSFKYRILGRTIRVTGSFTLGSTSAITGNVAITLPISSAINYTNNVCEFGKYFVGNYMGQLTIIGNLAYIYAINTTGTYMSATTLSATIPFTWGTNDDIKFDIAYSF